LNFRRTVSTWHCPIPSGGIGWWPTATAAGNYDGRKRRRRRGPIGISNGTIPPSFPCASPSKAKPMLLVSKHQLEGRGEVKLLEIWGENM
jgi:hypothetical protein